MTTIKRISKDTYYMKIAEVVSLRSTCIRAHAGAVIVKNDNIISTGYSGSPRGSENCCDKRVCIRQVNNIVPGSNYELCQSVHAEANALLNAAISGVSVSKSEMYIYFVRFDGSDVSFNEPCKMCARFLKNTGVTVKRFFTDTPINCIIG